MADDSVEARLARLERDLVAETKLRNQQVASHEQALTLQANVYEHRLSELNNAHARAEAEQQRTVPRETFDTYVKSTDQQWRVADERFKTIEKEVTILSTRLVAWLAAVGTGLLLLQIGIQLLTWLRA